MSQARIRQIARLQRLAQPCLKQKEQDDRKWQQTIRGAANHAAVLAFLIRYGKPRIDEPLSDACERCAQSAAWKDCCDEFKSLLVPGSEYLRLEFAWSVSASRYGWNEHYRSGTPSPYNFYLLRC